MLSKLKNFFLAMLLDCSGWTTEMTVTGISEIDACIPEFWGPGIIADGNRESFWGSLAGKEGSFMPVIDKIESGYNREIVKGFNSKGESIKAYIYVWKGEKSLKDSKIENGDWVKYIEELIEKNTLYPIFDKNDIILFDMDEYFISDNSDEIDDKDNEFKNKEFKSYEFSNDIFKFLDNYDEFSDENENDYLEITDDEKLDAYDLWKKYKDRY